MPAIRLVPTDSELDAWIARNGPLPDNFGQTIAFLRRCEQEERDLMARLEARLSAPDAPKLYFVPGVGLSDCPF